MAGNDFDVVVIGSGGGAAPLVNTLVHAGKSVLVLEKGPLLRTQYQSPDGLSDFKRDAGRAYGVAAMQQYESYSAVVATLSGSADALHLESLFETDIPYLRGAEPAPRFVL